MTAPWRNPAGGLRYHARALSSRRLWAPFKRELGTWLTSFQPRVKRAVLVGPSAAYTFPDAFLAQFSELTVFEPDPVALLLLKRRLRSLGVERVRIEPRDQLLRPLLAGDAGLAELLAGDPELTLVFGNVLGQTSFLLREPDFERFKSAFRERIAPLLASRSWLSFHDRLSGSVPPSIAGCFLSRTRLSDASVLRELYSSEKPGRVVELFDHQSDGLFSSELPHAYFSWQIEAARYHLIEAVASGPK